MSKDIVKVDTLALTDDQKSLIKRTVANGCTDDELQMFLYQCERTKLDPFSKQIHMIKRGNRATIQTGIDGYRAIAERTGKYAGNDEYTFDGGNTQWEIMAKGQKHPKVATACIKKIVSGVVCEFTASASWDEYCPGKGQDFMWNKMPFLMLGKCAEGLALRKAFPNDLSGIYTDEEMDQADSKNINTGVEVKTEAKTNDLKKQLAAKNTPKKEEKVEEVVEVVEEVKEPVGPKRMGKKTEENIKECLKSIFIDDVTKEKVEKWLGLDEKPTLSAANECLDKLNRMIEDGEKAQEEEINPDDIPF